MYYLLTVVLGSLIAATSYGVHLVMGRPERANTVAFILGFTVASFLAYWHPHRWYWAMLILVSTFMIRIWLSLKFIYPGTNGPPDPLLLPLIPLLVGLYAGVCMLGIGLGLLYRRADDARFSG